MRVSRGTALPRRSIIAIPSLLEAWFLSNQRPLPWRTTYDPYQVWVSEVMLQQTRMDVVLRYFPRFMAKFPSVEILASANDEDVLATWSGLGYYRRAGMLLLGARAVVDKWGGRIPRDSDALRSIPGVGRYTAGAIASIAFGLRTPIVEGNVRRVGARLAAVDWPLGSRELDGQIWSLATSLVAHADSPRDFNQGLMELGALVCRVGVPECGRCPLTRHCLAYRTGTPEDFPRKGAKASSRSLDIPLYLVSDAQRGVLMRKESGALMRGMFHLPHGNDLLLPGGRAIAHLNGTVVGSFAHTITNRRIRFEVIALDQFPDCLGEGADEYKWILPGELVATPHPSYVRKALELAGLL
ncbi:MAG TPA: A/G-specific adenine glycosylase [Thermoanaerobaculia bacterium]|nr:A/G-specific adenine glycosylase [Thermoanaerobaculia bacterium]